MQATASSIARTAQTCTQLLALLAAPIHPCRPPKDPIRHRASVRFAAYSRQPSMYNRSMRVGSIPDPSSDQLTTPSTATTEPTASQQLMARLRADAQPGRQSQTGGDGCTAGAAAISAAAAPDVGAGDVGSTGVAGGDRRQQGEGHRDVGEVSTAAAPSDPVSDPAGDECEKGWGGHTGDSTELDQLRAVLARALAVVSPYDDGHNGGSMEADGEGPWVAVDDLIGEGGFGLGNLLCGAAEGEQEEIDAAPSRGRAAGGGAAPPPFRAPRPRHRHRQHPHQQHQQHRQLQQRQRRPP